MAFLYRTPQQNFLATLNKEDADAINSVQSKRLLQTETSQGELFNYYVGEEGLKFLTQNGVYVSPNAHVNHTHPVSKMLENHFLYVLVPQVVAGRNVLAISLKKRKSEMLRSRMNSDLSFLNRLIEDKDRSRYSEASSIGNSLIQIQRSMGTADTIFFHDEIHHWSDSDLLELLQIPRLNRVIATIVYPIEETFGSTSSLNPVNYEYEITGDKIVHAPDGYWSESYVQRRNPSILRARKVISNGVTWTVCFHNSIGDHHLISIERGDFVTKQVLYFNNPQIIPLNWLGFKHLHSSRPLRLRFEVISKVFIYLMSLKKPDVESACAKIRQLSEEGLIFDEAFFMAHLASEMKRHDWRSTIDITSLFSKVKEAIKKMIPEQLQLMMCPEEFFSRKFIETILDLKRKPFKVMRGILDSKGLTSIDFDIDIDPFDYLINDWSFGKGVLIQDRRGEPYLLNGTKVLDFMYDPHFASDNFYMKYLCNGEIMCFRQRPSNRPYTIVPQNYLNYKEAEKMGTLITYFDMDMGKKRKVEKVIPEIFKRPYYRVPRSALIVEIPQICWYEDWVDVVNDQISITLKGINFDDNKKISKKKEGVKKVEQKNLETAVEKLDSEIPKSKEIAEEEDCDIDIEGDDDFMDVASEEGLRENLEALQEFEVDLDDLQRKIESRSLKNICLLEAIGDHLKMDRMTVFSVLSARSSYWAKWLMNDEGATVDDVQMAMSNLGLQGSIWTEDDIITINESSNFKKIELYLLEGHVTSKPPLKFSNKGKKIVDFDSGRSHNQFEKNITALPLISEITIEISDKDARELRGAFERGYTGVMLNSFKFRFDELHCRGERKVYTCFGFAGSGKTRSLINLIKASANFRSTLVISPRKNLQEDWKSKLDGIEGTTNRVVVKTFETALRLNLGEIKICVIDEIGLLPPGYLDLTISMLNEKAVVVLIGDPLQAEYYSKEDSEILTCPQNFEKVAGKTFKYAMYSHRLFKGQDIFELNSFGFEEKDEFHGHIFSEPAAMFLKLKEKNFSILSPSRAYAAHSKKFGNSFTFGEAQGLTFDFCVITIGSDGVVCDDGHWIVALTRSRKGFCFLLDHTMTLADFKEKTKGRMIWKVLNRMTISKQHLLSSTGRRMLNAIVIEDETKFCGENVIEERLEGDPWLKGMLDLCSMVELPEVDMQEPLRRDSPPKTHLMVSSGKSTSIALSQMKSRESREMKGKGMWSTQFEDTDQRRRNIKCQNWAESVENIYPRHRPDDTMTFFAAVKKRLRFSNPIKNNQALNKAEKIGKVMFDVFKKQLNLRNDIKVDISEVEKKFIEKRISKSKAMIANHAERSDPDWRLDHFFLFMKAQLCTKFEKRFTEAKAGQTLACFAHKVLVRFGLQTRILEEKIKAQLPKNFYIHTMKNFDDLNDFVLNNVHSQYGTDSDYEAFDRSQDANILAFEIEVLKFFNWDSDLINDYKIIKLNLGCRLGHLAIMRFTGEFCTFLFNTIANMAFTFMRYFIPEGTPVCFAGDDMYAEGYLRKRYDFEWVLEKIALKAKVNYSKRPMFCGWYITPMGIIKEPRLLLERWQNAEEKGNLSECLINYSIEASYGYRLGEEVNYLIDNVEDFQELIRKVIKKKHKLPFHVRHLFESIDGFGGGQFFSPGDEQNGEHHKSCGLQCNLH